MGATSATGVASCDTTVRGASPTSQLCREPVAVTGGMDVRGAVDFVVVPAFDDERMIFRELGSRFNMHLMFIVGRVNAAFIK